MSAREDSEDSEDREVLEDDASHGIVNLILTALYDTSGEMVEGAFVDRWESNAGSAIDELETIFRHHGFSNRDEWLLREIMRDPKSPPDAVVNLIDGLRAFTLPLVKELRQDPQAHARIVAIRVGARHFEPAFWLAGLNDPDAAVRAAAVTTLSEHRRKLPEAESYLIRALEDEDPHVRSVAGQAVTFYKHPAGGEALVRCLAAESNLGVRTAIIAAIAQATRSAGVHADPFTVAEGIGTPVKTLLLAELNHEAAEIRQAIASALERLRGVDVATAMLQRLLVESDANVRATLVLFGGYHAIAERALPLLASLLASDPDSTIRTRIAWLLESFGAPAIPLLIDALDDAAVGPRRAAATVTLGHIGNVSALPALTRELANAQNRTFHRELVTAIGDILLDASPSQPPTPSPQLALLIQQWIDALQVDSFGSWPVRVLKEHNALALHGNLIDLWGIRPDGQMLCLDHEAFGHHVEPESDPLPLFAAIVNGARTYRELRALVPVPPVGTKACLTCNSLGYTEDEKEDEKDGSTACMSCSGLGWWIASR